MNGKTKGWVKVLAFLAACAASGASAQTLYKLIDKNGKVTYSNEAPKDFDGKVIRIDVNPNANTATLPKYQDAPRGGDGVQRVPRKGGGAAAKPDLDALQAKVAERRKALEEAENNPSEEDVQWVGNSKGGVRRIPSEAYEQRLTQLARALKEAEDELQAAQKQGH